MTSRLGVLVLIITTALDTPFLLLPFRPNADPNAARNFIRNFFKNGPGQSVAFHGESLKKEMRLIEPMVHCAVRTYAQDHS